MLPGFCEVKKAAFPVDGPTPPTPALEEALALPITEVLQQSGGDVVALATGERHEGVTLREGKTPAERELGTRHFSRKNCQPARVRGKRPMCAR